MADAARFTCRAFECRSNRKKSAKHTPEANANRLPLKSCGRSLPTKNNDIPNPERCVALMKRPPVLHRIAAPSTSNRGELLIFHFSFDIDHLPSCQKPDREGGPLRQGSPR